MDIKDLKIGYERIFNASAETIFFSPGRINLIGEHTDYNGGHVFPAAISLGTYAAVGKRDDQKLGLYSDNFPGDGTFIVDLGALNYRDDDGWTNYVKGIFSILSSEGKSFPFGLNIFVKGDLPAASGLSSSASMELLIGTIVNTYYHFDIPQLDLIKLGQHVENQYIGVNSGIMDQFAVGMGKKNQGIFLDTNTLEYHYYPLDLADKSIVIMNTNKPRNLISGKYNERRAECEQALEQLQKGTDIHTLADLDEVSFDEYAYLIENETLIKRARHAVFENQRTLRAAEAMTADDMETFGRLMNASHVSLEYDYEVTGLELDTLVHTAWQQSGVLGTRMTGAGFGGCAIALVENKAIPLFEERVAKAYKEKTDFQASFYVTEISDGPRLLEKL